MPRPADFEWERHHLALPGSRRRILLEHCHRRLTRTLPTMSSREIRPSMIDESDLYYFYAKEIADNISDRNMFFSRMPKFDLKLLRTYLRKLFEEPDNRRTFYIDDDGDNVPIDCQCSHRQALKLSYKAVGKNKAIPLIVGSFNLSSDEVFSYMRVNHLDKKLVRNINANPTWKGTSWNDILIFEDPCIPLFFYESKPFSKYTIFPRLSQRKMNPEYDEHRYTNYKLLPNQKRLDAKQCNESNETKIRMDEQTESKDLDVQGELKSSLQHCSDVLPPLWFTKYMESMKKDMVSTITNEVVENVTKALTERLDSLMFSSLKNQSGNQSSSLARYPQCSSDSNEDNQKKIKSQDKQQLSDVSIERVDESQNNTMKNIQMKKDVISTITNEVVKEVTELLEKIPVDSLTPVSSKDPLRNQFLSHFPSSTRLPQNSFDSYLSEKNQKTLKSQNREQSSDNVSTVTVNESSRYSKILENCTRLLQKRLIDDTNAEKEKKKRQHQQITQTIVDLSGNIGREKEQSVQNNTRDLISQKNLPLQMDSKLSNDRVYLEMYKLVEKELRMNCSVTGHQMLNEDFLNRDICDTEKDVPYNLHSSWSYNQEKKEEKEKEEVDDAFEIIQIPALNDDYTLFIPFEEPAIEQHHDSNRDSPSFELLSEPPSPPSSIHLNEDHFSANEEKLELQFMKTNPTDPIYVLDVHGKIFNGEHQMTNPDECVNVNLKKQPDVTYFFAEDKDLLTEDEDEERSSKSPCAEHQSNERKSSRDDANSSYDDVRNSHASYLTVQTHCDSKTQSQCSCQSQTDSGDFTQSFHSHTTSVTDDTTDIYVHTQVRSMYNEPVITTAKDVGETTTTAITTATATPKNNHDIRVDDGWTKETRTNEKYRHKCSNNYPEYSSTPNNNCSCSRDPSFGASCQSYRASRSSDRSCSNIGSRKTSASEQALLNTADSVHILPETLVSAAAQVGSFAYDTPREMFD